MLDFKVCTFFLLLLVSCKKDKLEISTPMIPELPNEKITYTNHVNSIMDYRCRACHSSETLGELPFLETYEEVKLVAESGALEQRMINEYPTAMPPGVSVPQKEKEAVINWIEQGCLE